MPLERNGRVIGIDRKLRRMDVGGLGADDILRVLGRDIRHRRSLLTIPAQGGMPGLERIKIIQQAHGLGYGITRGTFSGSKPDGGA